MYRIWQTQWSQQMWSQSSNSTTSSNSSSTCVCCSVVFDFGDTTTADLPSLPLLKLNMWVGTAEVPTTHSVESQRFTKSVTKSLGI